MNHNFDEAGPITQEFLLFVKKRCMCFSYGEFEGFKHPTVSELRSLKCLLEGAIEEQIKKECEED